MRKLFVLFAIFISIMVGIITAQAAYGIRLYLDGEELESDVLPIIINERTMVPVRVIFEKLNADVEWNQEKYEVHITAPGSDIVFHIGSNTAYLNGNEVVLDAVPVILHDRTLVPIRFVSESLGYKVSWDDLTKAVFINSPETIKSEAVSDICSVTAEDDNVVEIRLTKALKPRVSTVDNPFRLVLDFDNTTLSISDGKNTLGNDCVTEVRWALHELYSRVVIEFNGEHEYEINGMGTDVLSISVQDNKDDSSEEVTEPDSSADALPEGENTESENTDNGSINLVPEDFEPLPEFEQMLIVIDAGHGGKDVGALARDENGEILLDSNGKYLLQEKHVNLVIAQKIRDRLQAMGIRVLMTRDDDTFTGTNKENLMARCDLANENNATLFVSVHNNSAESPKATGTEICYTEESDGSYGITSKVLANNILPYLVGATGLQNRGIINRPNLVVLKNTAMPAVLLECAFISCETDRDVLLSEEKLNDIADGVAMGIVKSMKQIATNMKAYR